MKDEDKTKEQLIDELVELRQRIAELEASETERERVEEALRDTNELLEKIFSTTYLLIACMDTDFNFVRVNRAYAEADGREPEFFVGKNHFDLYPNEENEAIFRRVVETGEPYTTYAKPFEYVEHPERGVTYWDWDLHPVKDVSGKVERLVLGLVNVTERVKAGEELRKHRDHLEELVAERTAELAAANEQLQREITERKQVEEALRESEARFRQLAETVQDAFWLGTTGIGKQRRVLYVSPAFEKMFGIKSEEIYKSDRVWLETVHEEDRDHVLSTLERFLQDQGDYQVEYRIVRPDGTMRWIWARGFAIRDEKGEMYRTAGLAQDITERKRAEEALQQHARDLELLNRTSQAFGSTLDLDQVLFTVLEEVRQMLGVVASSAWLIDLETDELVCRQATGPKGEIVRGWRLALGEGIAGWVAHHDESLIVPDTRADDRYFRGIDQQTGLDLRSILSVPLRVKQDVIGVLEVMDTEVGCLNPTHLKLLEPLAASAAIAIENARLYEQAQQEIAERERIEEALRQYTIELEARNEELDAFAHTVAHDLKDPLGHIVGFAQVLEKDYATLPEEELRRYLHTMVQSGRKMSNIIDELLLLAGVRKMEEMEVEPLDMAGIVDEAQGRLAHLVEKHQAEIILPDAWPVVLGYGPWVEEVWVNYLSNAIQYGGRPPRVELGATEQADGMVCFWVRDNGPGLTLEEQARLFTPFTQFIQIRAKGHGLGLSIVRRIVEKLGGQVGVESEVGRGSVFTFTLPGMAS